MKWIMLSGDPAPKPHFPPFFLCLRPIIRDATEEAERTDNRKPRTAGSLPCLVTGASTLEGGTRLRILTAVLEVSYYYEVDGRSLVPKLVPYSDGNRQSANFWST